MVVESSESTLAVTTSWAGWQLEFPLADTDRLCLRDEAATMEESSEWRSTDRFGIDRDGQVSSPSRSASSPPGTSLHELHERPALVRQLRSMTGWILYPTRSSYLFYRPGDFLGIHTDVAACKLTLITVVVGHAGPLVVYPDLVDASPESLLELARATHGAPPGGQTVEVPTLGFLAIAGTRVPHRRPTVSAPATVATLCYERLL